MIGSLFKIGQGIKQNKAAKKINPVWQQYQENPYAKQQLGTAQNLFNAPMFGGTELQQKVFANQGNAIGNINRNATDGTQALAMGALAQGQTNDALQDYQIKNAQNKYSMLNNLNAAYGGMIQEGDKVYNSVLQKYMMDVQRKDNLQASGAQNIYGGLDDITSQAIQVAGMGLPGLGGLFGKNSRLAASMPTTARPGINTGAATLGQFGTPLAGGAPSVNWGNPLARR